MSKVGLIVQREFLSRVRKKSFIIMTIAGPIVIAGLLSLAVYLGVSDSSIHSVLVADLTASVSVDSTGQAQPIFYNKLKDTDQLKFHYVNDGLTNPEFESSEYSIMIVLREDIITYPKAEMVYREIPSLSVRSYIKEQVEKVIEREKLKINEISAETYDSIRTDLDLLSVDAKDGTRSFDQEQAMVGFGFAILIYFFIFIYGVQVMRGVMEEKSSRIVEVIISSVRPFQLMMGKIVGIALVGLTQFVLWIILTGVIFTIIQSTILPDFGEAASMAQQVQVSGDAAKDVANDPMAKAAVSEVFELIFFRINWPLMIGMFLFYFLGGYLLYASLFAAVGAAVDNETDTQQFMMPITIPLVFGFIVSEFALTNPAGQAVFWFSQIPLTSPVVMMVRVAMGFDSGNIWQLLSSMALLILGFLSAVWLAGKIYRTGILLYGKKVGYKEIWKWLKYKS